MTDFNNKSDYLRLCISVTLNFDVPFKVCRHRKITENCSSAIWTMYGVIHTEKSNKMQQCIRMYHFIFIWNSTCFGRHTAQHQEPKTALAASGFAYVEGLYTRPDSVQQPHVQQPSTYAKPEAASAVLGSWWWAVCRSKHIEFHVNMEW
jgi:hypothetical protein